MKMIYVKLMPAREDFTVDWNLIRVQNYSDRLDGFTLVINVLTKQFTLMKRVCRLISVCADHGF